VLEALSEATTETAVVTAWLEQQALVLDVVLTPRPFRPYVRPGHIFRGPQNANVQVFLAYLPSDEVRAFITRAEKSSSSPEGGNLQKFEERLSDVRIRGLAYDLEEQTEGISAAAAPVFDASAQVRASLGVIAPAERFSAADIVNYDVHLKRAASILSRELGYQGSHNGPTP
jgi:DNA-binding IclR family transcriptional regulator